MREEKFLGGVGRGGHAYGFLLNFSKVTGDVIIMVKLLIFFDSSVMLPSGLKIHHH